MYMYSFNMLFCNLLFSVRNLKYTKYFSILVPIDLAHVLKNSCVVSHGKYVPWPLYHAVFMKMRSQLFQKQESCIPRRESTRAQRRLGENIWQIPGAQRQDHGMPARQLGSKEACGVESRSAPDEVEACLPVTCWQLECYNWILFSGYISGLICWVYTTGCVIFYHMAMHIYLKLFNNFLCFFWLMFNSPQTPNFKRTGIFSSSLNPHSRNRCGMKGGQNCRKWEERGTVIGWASSCAYP